MQQVKLAKGRTFTRPQKRLNRILEILDKDMVCAFCESWLYAELCKVMEYGEFSVEEIKENCDYFGVDGCIKDCKECEYSPNDFIVHLNEGA